MGPIRRRLSFLVALLLPTPALGSVCASARPNWDGETVSDLTETLLLFSSIPAIVLLVATAIVWRLKSAKGGLAVVSLWAILLTITTSFDPGGVRTAAQAEGCVGSTTLFVLAVIAICVATVLRTAPARATDTNGDE